MDLLLHVLNINSSPEYVNKQDDDGNTALMSALIGRNFDMAMVLLSTGVCNTNLTNIRGENCAHIAALHGNLDMLKILAEHGTNLLAVTKTSTTIMHYAMLLLVNWDMIRWLLEEVPGLPENSYNSVGKNVISVIKNQSDKLKYIGLVEDIRKKMLSLYY